MQGAVGVDHSTISRWLDAEKQQPTSMENCLRIAKACAVTPETVFRIVGKEEFGPLLRHYAASDRTSEEIYGNPLYNQLVQRFDRLLRLGWSTQLDQELQRLERYWSFMDSPFRTMAQEFGAEAAFLALGRSDVGQTVLCAFNIDHKEALGILGDPPQGWRKVDHRSDDLDLSCCIKGGEFQESGVSLHLRSWAISLQSLK